MCQCNSKTRSISSRRHSAPAGNAIGCHTQHTVRVTLPQGKQSPEIALSPRRAPTGVAASPGEQLVLEMFLQGEPEGWRSWKKGDGACGSLAVISWRWDPAILRGLRHCLGVAPGPGAPRAGHLVTPAGVVPRGSKPETFSDSQQGQIFEGTAPKSPEAEAVVPSGPLTEARLAAELSQRRSFTGQGACRWHRRCTVALVTERLWWPCHC